MSRQDGWRCTLLTALRYRKYALQTPLGSRPTSLPASAGPAGRARSAPTPSPLATPGRLERGLAAPLSTPSVLPLPFLPAPVGEDEDAVRTDLLRVHELQGLRLFRVPEKTLAFAHDDREDHQAVLIDEIRSISVLPSCPLPKTRMSLPSCCLSLETPSATSPSMRVELFHSSGSCRVLEATCLG